MNRIDDNQTSIYERLTNFDINKSSVLNADLILKFANYNETLYLSDLDSLGIEKTWNDICEYLLANGENDCFLQYYNLGELYEIALEHLGKQDKKNNGQYYTPRDVALLMSQWFDNLDAENICDVACGTGNLILEYFDYIGEKRTREILSQGKLYLYDNDAMALKICKTILVCKYGIEYNDVINIICDDFLNAKITLPENCKVIVNPPYSKITTLRSEWQQTNIVVETKEYYAAFFEKILKQSKKAVIISPYSFLGAEKFFSLRKLMNSYNGFIISFDNVPGNIFSGKKHGVFNSNNVNSVRAAITVVENKPEIEGFRISPLIRFKSEERGRLLQSEILCAELSNRYQTVNDIQKKYYKCEKTLLQLFDSWIAKSNKKLKDYIDSQGKFSLFIPTTCRYYTVASGRKLKRKGQIELKFNDRSVFSYVYCLINSSFAYWYWRLYDGGINFNKQLLLNLPVFYDILTEENKRFFENLSEQMMTESEKYIIKKNNKGIQENIKFPIFYRDIINNKMIEILAVYANSSVFDKIHSNRAFEDCLL